MRSSIKQKTTWALLCLTAFAIVACDSGYRKAKVVKLVSIDTPANLSTDSHCRSLWRDIQRFSLEMDELSDEWNEYIVESAYQLINRGCVIDKLDE